MNRSINAQVNCHVYDFGVAPSLEERIKSFTGVNCAFVTFLILPECASHQHELSHNFGCVDGECTTGSSCIMNGGFDNNSSYNLSNIWCSNCIADFDASLH